jgi:hypothetical protein
MENRMAKEGQIKRTCNVCMRPLTLDKFYTAKGTKESEEVKYERACKSCWNNRSAQKKALAKSQAVEYKGGKCIKCGYNKCINALEFHHRDPKTKDTSVNAIRRSFNSMKKELDKCDLLCANCHREVHADLRTFKESDNE